MTQQDRNWNNRTPTTPIWVFMAATAMATTVSTLAATAMVQADEPAAVAVAVTCECEAPAPVAVVTEVGASHVESVQATAPEVPDVRSTEPPPASHRAASASPRVPRVRQAKATVSGSLDRDVVRRIVRSHINEVRYCYNQGLMDDPELVGRVSVQFTIGGDGSVSASEVASSTLEAESVSTCIAKAVKRWRFPKPAGAKEVTVTYPFVLSPG